LRIFSEELRQQDAAVRACRGDLNLAEDLYRQGLVDYTGVSTAQIALLGAQNSELGLRMQEATACVQLIEALGGGWTAPPKT
jgi:outer membrane protein TolC